MKGEIEIHQRETTEETESFLQENMDKIKGHSNRVVELLYSGKKYTAKEVNDLLNMAEGGRRLREIFISRKDCKKEWRLDSNGKRLAVQYWLEGINPPTKTAVIAKFHSASSDLKKVEDNLSVVFSLPDIPQDKIYQQQTLFP